MQFRTNRTTPHGVHLGTAPEPRIYAAARIQRRFLPDKSGVPFALFDLERGAVPRGAHSTLTLAFLLAFAYFSVL